MSSPDVSRSAVLSQESLASATELALVAEERDWLLRIRAGDDRAFESIYKQYRVPLTTFALRYLKGRTDALGLAEDIVQEVFTRFWLRRHVPTAHTTLRAYLCSAVRNETLNRIARAKIETSWQLDEESLVAAATLPAINAPTRRPDETAQHRELAAALATALANLPPRARAVAILRWSDGLSRTEVAEVLHVAVPTVNNHLTMAMRALRHALQRFRPDR